MHDNISLRVALHVHGHGAASQNDQLGDARVGEALAHNLLADEAGGAGDDDLHGGAMGGFFRWWWWPSFEPFCVL